MKKMMMLSIAAFLFFGCRKDAGDTKAPAIVITSPTNGQIYTAGQTVNIVATVTDEDEIHSVHLFVYNKANYSDIIHEENHIDKNMYTLTRSFTAQAGINYLITVQAEDHSYNQSQANVEVSAK